MNLGLLFAQGNRWLVGVPLLFFIYLTACNSNESLQIAQQGVDRFRSQIEAAQYEDVYAEADEGLHKSVTRTDFTAYMQLVHSKLGNRHESRLSKYQASWFVHTGTLVTLVYHTQFSGGNASEQFIWHIRKGRAYLYGYRIDSQTLKT